MFLVVVLLFGQEPLVAAPRLATIFGDNMVLQREIELPVWGWADPGDEITVTFAGQIRKAIAGSNGEWNLKLDRMIASGEAREFKVSSSKGKAPIILKNVLVGDVWFCAGQSNMAMSMGDCKSPDDTSTAKFPEIRCVKISNVGSWVQDQDVSTSGWSICAPQTVAGFTAVGFFFAREVHQITRIPIGLIDDDWSGSAIEPWCSRASLDGVSDLDAARKMYESKSADYRKALAERLFAIEQWTEALKQSLAENKELPRSPLPHDPAWPRTDPCTIFNAMVAPLIPYGIKGVLWYQGEGNGTEGGSYFHKMRALIENWRTLWQQGDFPFYFVQLTNFMADNQNPEGGDGYAKIRCAQTEALTLPRTGMAVTIDIGDANEIHAKNKQDVGKRLALWALAKDYGKKDIIFSGPIFKEMKTEGSRIRITFDYIGSGLMVGKKIGREPTIEDVGTKLKRFAIAGEDKKWVWADAIIEKDSVVVSSSQVLVPVAVRYAYSADPEGANLYNKDGLPAVPFRTDNW